MCLMVDTYVRTCTVRDVSWRILLTPQEKRTCSLTEWHSWALRDLYMKYFVYFHIRIYVSL